jgi:hypothetical protein
LPAVERSSKRKWVTEPAAAVATVVAGVPVPRTKTNSFCSRTRCWVGVFRLLGMEHTYPRVVSDGFRSARARASSDWTVDAAIDFAGVAKGPCISLANHVVQIRTGQGKSVTLAGLSTVLALVGFEVH